jgi:site-specific recombinase XerD
VNGRIEKENKAKKAMEKKLEELPDIFTAFYEWMDAREKSYTTMNNYINHVVEFMNFYTKGRRDNKFYEKVTDTNIEKYMTSIRRKVVDDEEVEVGDDIRAAKWSSLNTFFKFLSQKKYITNNPMLLTERPRIRTKHTVTYMTPKEIESVFKRIAKEARPMVKNRDYCIVAMGLGTGLRVSAIVNINIEDIDFSTKTIKVIEKGRKTREVTFSDNLRSLLLVWMKDRELYFGGTETGPLFISQKKGRMSAYAVWDLVKKYTDHLPKHITPHKLRSSAAMNLHGAGVDVMTIASLLGHENITTTQRYVKAYDEDRKEATNILDNLIT